MATDRSTGFDTHDLRAVAGAFLFEHALGITQLDRAASLITILACLQANSSVPAPEDPVWQEVVAIGRALVVVGAFLKHDSRHETVAAAIGRLHAAGYKVSVKYGRPWMSPSQLTKATSKISELWDPIGLTTVFNQLAGQMRRDCVYDFDQYLLDRRYNATGRPASSPYGFIVQLAAKLPEDPVTATDFAANWKGAVSLARDLVSALDVEPHNQFWTINLAPRRLDAQLREVGLYDHLFGLRQWSLWFAPFMLRHFFGAEFDARLAQARGWTVADIVKLCEAVLARTKTDPAKLTRTDLKITGLSDAQLDVLLPHFVHATGQVNAGYSSPLAAQSAARANRPDI